MKLVFNSKWFILFWLGARGVTWNKVVHVRRDLWGEMGFQERGEFCTHEEVHVRQQSRIGWWKFAWKYATSKSFRFTVELEAYAASAQFWVHLGTPKCLAVLIFAGIISSKLYKCSSYSKAVAYLNATVTE